MIYEYDSDKLLSVKIFNKNETRFEKQLVTKNNSSFSYVISTDKKDRNSSEETLKFELIKNKYWEKGSYLQVGINRETFYKIFLVKRKKIQLPNCLASPEAIKILFTDNLPKNLHPSNFSK